jgi:hypothetical protein
LVISSIIGAKEVQNSITHKINKSTTLLENAVIAKPNKNST